MKAESEGIDNGESIVFVKNNVINELLAVSRVFCITSDLEGNLLMTVLESGAVEMPVLSLSLNCRELIDRYGDGVNFGGYRSKMEETLWRMVEDKPLHR